MSSPIIHFIINLLFANLSEEMYPVDLNIFTISFLNVLPVIVRCLHFSYKCVRTRFIRSIK